LGQRDSVLLEPKERRESGENKRVSAATISKSIPVDGADAVI
jgi:hypothetical protein